jgi:glycosyltransferase involved in cell wall biosynthesis
VTRRVIHYVDSGVFGGSEEAALHLMGSLDRARWEPVLLYHAHGGVARLAQIAERLGVRARVVPRLREGRRIAGLPPLWRAIRVERPAIFHAHLSWPLACRYGLLAAWLARVPALVATAHLYVELRGGPRPPLMLRPLRRIIAVSDEVKARYARELRVPEGRLTVVRNGIPVLPSVRSPDPRLRAELVRGRPDYVVLTAARLHEQKGHAYLLAAAAQVPDATFVLAGDGPLRPQLEAQARELGISERCIFLGHRTDVPDLLALADLLVLPSLWEGLPVSVLEGMAARRPIVATAIGGTDEAVAHESGGLLVPPRDAGALASAIRRVRADPRLAERLAAAGRERVEREFSSEVMARNVMRIYDEVMREVEAGGGADV